jgi:hypothetical protein
LDWIIFGIIVATLWGIAIEMLFKWFYLNFG